MNLSDQISPEQLLELVQNTTPFIFSEKYKTDKRPSELFNEYPQLGWQYILNSWPKDWRGPVEKRWVDYFLLCLSSHWCTVMSFVPTDVDLKIRAKLWLEIKKNDVVEEMVNYTLKLQQWEVDAVSKRSLYDDDLGRVSGHDGEYFTVLMGGLGRCLKSGLTECSKQLESAIDQELIREVKIFKKLLAKNNYIDLVRASAVLAHNAGDLSRVLELWDVPNEVRLHYRNKYYELGLRESEDNVYYKAVLIYKEFMASDNGRHLCLRAPRFLRNSAEYLLPLGPFFDGWAKKVIKTPNLKESEIIELISALLEGASRNDNQHGYTRALASIHRELPKGIRVYDKKISKSKLPLLKSLKVEEQSKISEEDYERRLEKKVKTFVENIKFD